MVHGWHVSSPSSCVLQIADPPCSLSAGEVEALTVAKANHPERVLTGRLGAYVLHSRYDSRELTRAARTAFESKFERDVDPDRLLGVRPRS